MKNFNRKTGLAVTAAAALVLAGCANSPTASYPGTYPTAGGAPTATYGGTAMGSYGGAAMGTEWGRVSQVEFMPSGSKMSNQSNGVIGAVIGAVVGGVVGRQVGGGTGRDVATVIGAGAGAYAGNQIARNAEGVSSESGYRVMIQTDGGAMRAFEVPNGGELRLGDRVRIENGVIYKM